MNANPKFIAATAQVDEAAVQPLPKSRKVYVQGSRPDLRVPMREISLQPTRDFAGRLADNESVGASTTPPAPGRTVVSPSHPKRGLPPLRLAWIWSAAMSRSTLAAPCSPWTMGFLSDIHANHAEQQGLSHPLRPPCAARRCAPGAAPSPSSPTRAAA